MANKCSNRVSTYVKKTAYTALYILMLYINVLFVPLYAYLVLKAMCYKMAPYVREMFTTISRTSRYLILQVHRIRKSRTARIIARRTIIVMWILYHCYPLFRGRLPDTRSVRIIMDFLYSITIFRSIAAITRCILRKKIKITRKRARDHRYNYRRPYGPKRPRITSIRSTYAKSDRVIKLVGGAQPSCGKINKNG